MESKYLHAGLIKARESVCEVGRFKFHVRRPTQMQQLLRRDRHKDNDLAVANESIREDVFGWEGVLESDIKRGESSDPVKFDVDLYRDWISDEPDVAIKIWEHLAEQIAQANTKKDAAKGN